MHLFDLIPPPGLRRLALLAAAGLLVACPTANDDDSAANDDDAADDDDSAGAPDGDGDGSPASEDCDDDDPLNYPGNVESCFDGQDNDCDGIIDRAQLGSAYLNTGGSSVLFDAPSPHDYAQGFTVEFWGRVDTLPEGDDMRWFWHRGGGTGAQGDYLLVDAVRGDGKIPLAPQLETRNGNTSGSTVASDGTTPVGTWTHVAVVGDPATGEHRFYIDGILRATETPAAAWWDSEVLPQGTLQIGGCCNGGGANFSIDDLRIWSVPRDDQQIAAHVCGPAVGSSAPGLMVNFDFEGGDFESSDAGPEGVNFIQAGGSAALASW